MGNYTIWLGGIMKLNKLSQGLVLIPLTGVISLMGTPAALAVECSTLSPCVVNSVSAASKVLVDAKVKVTIPQAQSVTAPVAPTLDSVTAPVKSAVRPVGETVNKVTAPVVDAVKNVASPITTPVAPITPIIPVLPEPVPVVPGVSAAPVTQPEVAPVEPVAVAEAGTNTEIVTPEDTKSASETLNTPQLHDSAAVSSGGLNGNTTLAPNRLEFQPAAVHSTEGTMTKFINSGGFGFGHLNPVDDPVGFTGLVFAYITVIGSAIAFAVKRSAFLNFRGLA